MSTLVLTTEVAATTALSQAESLLGETLRTGHIRYVFQPIWDLPSGSAVGFDATPRFRGGTSPLDVWSAASASDVRSPYERIAVRQAALQAHRLPGLLFVGLRRFGTESPGALQAAAAATFAQGRTRPERLVFELATADVEDVEQIGRNAARLRLLGAGLCLNASGDCLAPDRFDALAPALRFLKVDFSTAASRSGGVGRRQRWIDWARGKKLQVVAVAVDDRCVVDGLLGDGIETAQGPAFGDPAPAARWTPHRLEALAPRTAGVLHHAATPPVDAPPAARRPPGRLGADMRAPQRVPSVEEVAARWRPLFREDGWMSAVRNLQRTLERLARADRYVLWACLPPHGHWQRVATASNDLRVPTCLPPETEPMATVRSTLQPALHPPAPSSAAYGRILDEVHLRQTCLTPLTVPDPADGHPHFVGILALGWADPRPAPMTAPSIEQGELISVTAYLLAQRIQSTFIETALEWVASQPAPSTADEWVPLLDALAERFGGDHWHVAAVDLPPDRPATWHVVAENRLFPRMASAWAEMVRLHGDMVSSAPGLRTAAQNRASFLADLDGRGESNPAMREWQVRLRELGLRSLLTLPLGPGDDGRIGVLVVGWRHPRGWQQIAASVRPWEALRRLLAGWWREMTNARNTLHDPLTGVLNRRGVDRAWQEWAASAGTLGMLDCDGFHQVNILWGHLVGDDALRSLGRVLAEEVDRGEGWCGRWGGDEFLVRLPEGIAWADFGRRVQRRMAEVARERGWPQAVTISGGATRFRAPAPELETALDLADRALLRAKRAGRAHFLSYRRILG